LNFFNAGNLLDEESAHRKADGTTRQRRTTHEKAGKHRCPKNNSNSPFQLARAHIKSYRTQWELSCMKQDIWLEISGKC